MEARPRESCRNDRAGFATFAILWVDFQSALGICFLLPELVMTVNLT